MTEGSLIGKFAPTFKAGAVMEGKISELSLSSFLGAYVVFFFYPLDFTFVCPTELHAFQDKVPAFKQRNTRLIGCSVDSVYSHYAWLKVPKDKGGIQGITYPLVSDINKSIASDYQVLDKEKGITYRALFILDKEGVVRHQVVNDFPIGRSVDEVLRVIDALIHHEANGEVCPANWKAGERAMKSDQEGLERYFSVK